MVQLTSDTRSKNYGVCSLQGALDPIKLLCGVDNQLGTVGLQRNGGIRVGVHIGQVSALNLKLSKHY